MAPPWRVPPCCVLCWVLNAIQRYQASVSLPNPSVLSRPGQDRTCHLLVGFRQDLICVWRLLWKPLRSHRLPEKHYLGKEVVVHVVDQVLSFRTQARLWVRGSAELTELKMTVHPKANLELCFSGGSGSKHKVRSLWGGHKSRWTQFCRSAG